MNCEHNDGFTCVESLIGAYKQIYSLQPGIGDEHQTHLYNAFREAKQGIRVALAKKVGEEPARKMLCESTRGIVRKG